MQEALRANPPGSPARLDILVDLSRSLIDKVLVKSDYETTDVDYLIEYLQELLELMPPEDSRRDSFLTFFREALFVRFEPSPDFMLSVSDTMEWNLDSGVQFGCPSHIWNTILRYEKSPSYSSPERYKDPVVLISIGYCFYQKFEGVDPDSMADWNSQVEQEAFAKEDEWSEVEDGPLRDYTKHGASPELNRELQDILKNFNAYGKKLARMREKLPQEDDQPTSSRRLENLERAISYGEAALRLCPSDHDDRRFMLFEVARSYRSRFEMNGRFEDVECSIRYLREALELHPPGEYLRVLVFASLLRSLEIALARGDRSRIPGQILEDGRYLDLFENEVAAIPLSNVHHKHTMAESWIKLAIAAKLNHAELMKVHAKATNYLERCLVLRHSVETQHKFLASGSLVTHDLAAAIIEQHQMESAVEILEQGRTVLWSLMRGYRHSLDGLRDKDADLVDRFDHVCRRLEGLATSSLVSSSTLPEMTRFEQLYKKLETLAATSQSFSLFYSDSEFEDIRVFQRKEEHKILMRSFESMIEDIRRIDGMSHFLQAVPFSGLQLAAAEGPVIIINLTDSRSDALVITNRLDDPVVCVALDGGLPDTVTKLLTGVKRMNQAIRRGSRLATVGKDSLTALLRILWNKICEPVVQQLLRIGIPEQSRIWWCPTGKLTHLPLHAAGPYAKGKRNLSDIFISSYTPTLTALIQSRSRISNGPSSMRPHLLAVGQSKDLPSVKDELSTINTILGPQSSVLSGTNAVPDTVMSALQDHQWVHFACHGFINQKEPFQSAFKLHGRELPLRQIMEAHLGNAELAVLATCHSAVGEIQMPDEMLSLAVALQFCGFCSTVGTLWEMHDTDGPELAGMFYKYLLQEGKGDSRRSAEALHSAVLKMRDAGVPVERWATFVHIGA